MREALPFPAELGDPLTSPIAEVLALAVRPWEVAHIAHAFRDNAVDLPFKVEAETAYVLHWLLCLAIEHGAEWRRLAGERIHELMPAHEAARDGRRAAREAGRRAFEQRGAH